MTKCLCDTCMAARGNWANETVTYTGRVHSLHSKQRGKQRKVTLEQIHIRVELLTYHKNSTSAGSVVLQQNSADTESDSPVARPTCPGAFGRWTHTADLRRWCRRWRRTVGPAHTPHHWRSCSWVLRGARSAPAEGRWRSPAWGRFHQWVSSTIAAGWLHVYIDLWTLEVLLWSRYQNFTCRLPAVTKYELSSEKETAVTLLDTLLAATTTFF